MGETPPEEQEFVRVISLLDDEHVRTILAATSTEPHSAEELADRCGISTSNIYRRLTELCEEELLDERTRPRADGNHESVYTAQLTTVEVRFEDGKMTGVLSRGESDVADGLTKMWRNFE